MKKKIIYSVLFSFMVAQAPQLVLAASDDGTSNQAQLLQFIQTQEQEVKAEQAKYDALIEDMKNAKKTADGHYLLTGLTGYSVFLSAGFIAGSIIDRSVFRGENLAVLTIAGVVIIAGSYITYHLGDKIEIDYATLASIKANLGEAEKNLIIRKYALDELKLKASENSSEISNTAN